MKKNSGITLIALIITIIIMLILVAVTVSILINSGLIGKAKQAGTDTKEAYTKDSTLGDNIIIDGQEYANIQEYLDQNSENTIKNVYVGMSGTAIILQENGEVYIVTYNGNHGEYVSLENATIAETPLYTNVKEIYQGVYLSKTDELYAMGPDTVTKIADNVAGVYTYGLTYYITKT